MPDLELTSPAFEDGERIPREYGYRERNVTPPLRIDGVPRGTASLALIVDPPTPSTRPGRCETTGSSGTPTPTGSGSRRTGTAATPFRGRTTTANTL